MNNSVLIKAGKAAPRWHAILLVSTVCACAPEYRDAGSYRIVTVTDGLFGFRCQPRTDLYFVDHSSPGSEPVYLGTCGTPRFVTDQLGLPHDPSCYAVSEDGASLVYFHRPKWCGAGENAARKVGGVYRHSDGVDTLLYSERQVGQIWSRAEIDPHAIRVGWHSAEPSPSGAVCSQELIIGASGWETPEGQPDTIHGCRPAAGRDTTGTG